MSEGASALVAIDWGTTSARAYRLDASGAVLEVREAPLGIQQVRDGFAQALATLLGDWRHDPAPRLACGMIGSRQGWVEAPYVDCPATLDALVRGIVHAPDGALAIVPGLAGRDDEGVPDVMRGEETQIVGAVAPDSPATLAVLPGTHSKWALVRDGAIEAFATYMTGEVYAVLRDHSILGRMKDGTTQEFSSAAFARGVRAALAHDGPAGALLHRLFGARTLALRADLAPEDTGDYLSGLLIGSEVVAGRDWARARDPSTAAVLLVGSAALCDLYQTALHEAGTATHNGPEHAAARGLWRIAQAAELLR
ncbi:MAG: 2-dehydro-3-deoxygalactonokinase [Casimicrobiaceae bacterium]